MNIGPNLAVSDIAAAPWAAAFLREQDLMIAANVLASMESGRPLYNADFDRACAQRLIPLDGGLDLRQLDLVEIPLDADPRLQNQASRETLKRTLGGTPRGHWAVFRLGDRYDAFMSNGLGGIETESGHKFTRTTATAAGFTGPDLYAHVLSMMHYLRRNVVQNAIIAHSCEAGQVVPGKTARNVDLKGKTWSRIVYAGKKTGYYVGGTDAYAVTAHRRGVRAQGFILEPTAFCRVFGLDYVLPEAFLDAGNDARVLDIVKPERRVALRDLIGPAVEIRLA